jgi:hypothetical protein
VNATVRFMDGKARGIERTMSQKTCREGESVRGCLRCEAKEIESDRFMLSMREMV